VRFDAIAGPAHRHAGRARSGLAGRGHTVSRSGWRFSARPVLRRDMPRRRRTAGSAGCRLNRPSFASGAVSCRTKRFRTRPISPEGASFKPLRCQRHRNSLISYDSDIRTKTGVVRLCQRKGAYRDARRPEMGSRAGAPGSEEWPRMPAFCAVPAVAEGGKKNVPTGETGGAGGTRTLSSRHLWQCLGTPRLET
jgi:hypothetical protein